MQILVVSVALPDVALHAVDGEVHLRQPYRVRNPLLTEDRELRVGVPAVLF